MQRLVCMYVILYVLYVVGQDFNYTHTHAHARARCTIYNGDRVSWYISDKDTILIILSPPGSCFWPIITAFG
jgi:hypothetical protein